MSGKRKTVVVCPLDWGLGHATRMIPVIETLLAERVNVVIAADNRPLALLKQHFPACFFEQLPGYQPHYPAKGALMPFKLMADLPSMIKQALKSRKLAENIVKKHQADALISDNRYELFQKNIFSVFVTHQLHLQTFGWQKVFQPWLNMIIKFFLKKYDEVWIPDFEGEKNLSGKLSHPVLSIQTPQHYIGTLSRFEGIIEAPSAASCDILIILSGPEPLRTLLEETLKKQALKLDVDTIMVLGKPEESLSIKTGRLQIFSHLDDQNFAGLIKKTKLIVSRPGYSTLMDLSCFGKKAAFIPTPGQTEQIYLADKLKNDKIAYTNSQNNFVLSEAWETRNDYRGIPQNNHSNNLSHFVSSFLELIAKKQED